jgi:hypothetical protein
MRKTVCVGTDGHVYRDLDVEPAGITTLVPVHLGMALQKAGEAKALRRFLSLVTTGEELGE